MWTIDVLKSRAFRLALAFALAIAAAAAVVFTLIYLQFSAASERMVSARLTDEATRALDASDDELRAQITQRLASDQRRLDYAGLFDAQGALLLGNPPSLPPIRPDGRAHIVLLGRYRDEVRRDSDGNWRLYTRTGVSVARPGEEYTDREWQKALAATPANERANLRT